MDSSSGHNQEMRTTSEQSMGMAGAAKGAGERKPRPVGEQALKCPRCESANTKFCYYNNYSLTQPRYFCKSCRRYWTKGGTLRNVPVGGGCRKNRRPSSSSAAAAAKRAPHDHHHLITTTNSSPASFPILPQPPPPYDQNDLTLAFSRLQNEQQLCSMFGNASSGFLDALKTGFLDSSPSPAHHNHNGVNYYGYNLNNGNSSYDNDEDDTNDRIALQDHHQAMIKNELCNGNYNNASIMRSSSDTNDHNNRVLWGLPWQLNGSSDHNNINGNIGNMVDFDASTTTTTTGREIWNGFASSNWHGLLNTAPLM